MNDNKLIAQALLDIAKNSTTEFIEVAQDSDLIEAAKKFNIVLPSPDLAVIKTVYAEIDKVNRNGVILPRPAVEKGLPTLIGKQINWEHQGSGRICGYIIDAKVNKDLIEITGVIFKSLFPEEMEMVKDKFDKKDLCVSFEIWNRDPENGNSVVTELENGFRSIDPIIFHGCGLLLANKPACPKAKVYSLVAKVLSETEKIVEKVFGEDLIFASLAIEESVCKGCSPCTCDKDKEVQKVEDIKLEEILENDYEGGEIEEAKKLTTEQRNALPDDDFALIQEKDGKKVRRFPINDEAHVRNALARLPQAKDMTEEERKACMEKILKKAKELNMEDIVKKHMKAEEKPEDAQVAAPAEETKPAEVAGTETKPVEAQAEAAPVECPKVVKITTEETVSTIEIPNETGSSVERKGSRKCTRVYSDGKEEVSTEEFTVVDTYSLAQLEEKVNAAKAEKDTEIATLKTVHETETADLKTATESLDKEIKKLQDELGKKDQEIAELKTPKVEPKKEGEMTVGAVEGEKETEIKRQAKNVNDIIASKHDQK
jgi:hypothetical protein